MIIDSVTPAPLGQPRQDGSANLVDKIGRDFSEMLAEVNRLHAEAEAKVEEFATTPEKDIHGTLIAMQRAIPWEVLVLGTVLSLGARRI